MNNMLNQIQSPGIINGSGHSIFPAASSSRGPSSHHPQQYRRQDACHRQHLLPPVALTTLPPPASNTLRYCSVQPIRSSCSPAPLAVGDSNGESPQRPDEPAVPLLSHRSADHDYALQQGRRHVTSRSAVLGASVRSGMISNHLPHLVVLQLDGGDEETEHSIKLPAKPAATPRYPHDLSDHQYLTGEELLVPKCKATSSGDDGVEILGPRTSGTLGFDVMDDEYSRYFRLLTQDYYHTPVAGRHLDRQRRDQAQLLFPGRHEEELPRVVTLAVSVSSAVKLEGKQMDQIAKKMRKLTGFDNLRVENMVDPSLIAGFVIRYGEDDAHVIDLSVKGRLAELEARLQSSDQSAAGADGGWISFPDMH